MRFSLTETAVVFIATVVFGALVMRLFILSGQTRDKAADLERAVETASGLIDVFNKHEEGVDGFLSDGVLLPYTLAHGMGESVTVQKFYNASWEAVTEEHAAYSVKLILTPDIRPGVPLCAIRAEAFRQTGGLALIAALDTYKYYGT